MGMLAVSGVYSWTPLKATQPQAPGPWPGEISRK